MNLQQAIEKIRKNVPALQLGSGEPTIPSWIEARGGRTFWVDGDHAHVLPSNWKAVVAADGETVIWTEGGQVQAYLCAAKDHEDVDNATALEIWNNAQAAQAANPAIMKGIQQSIEAELAEAPDEPERETAPETVV